VFAIIILSVIAGLYRSGHEEFVGGNDDPEDGKAVAGTIFTAVIVYAVRRNMSASRANDCSNSYGQVFLVFCGCQGLLHVRESRRGAISL
jgi:ribonuclease kappa